MAAATGGARRALAGLRSASPSTLPRTFSRPAVAQSPGLAASALPRTSRRRPSISRVPLAALGGVQGSLMPLHSATASALLTSMLGLKPGSWGWLSEGVVRYLNIFAAMIRMIRVMQNAFVYSSEDRLSKCTDLQHLYNRNGVSVTAQDYKRLFS